MSQIKTCSPTCQAFKCAKNATVCQRDNTWCRWTEETCDVSNCTYAMCTRRRLLPKGVCGEAVKRKTIDKQPDEVIPPTVKLRGKTARRIGEKEIF